MEKNVRNFKITLSAMIIAAFFIMPFTVNGQTGKANFAGTWAYNAEKSTIPQGQGQPPQGQGGQGQGQGQRGGFGGRDFVAAQEANLLTVTRTRTNQAGETTKTELKYTLDGKESTNVSARGGESKSIATWSADGKTLTIVTTRTFDMNGESRTMKTTDEWTLTDANTLSVKTTSASPNGDRVSTMVYDKK